MYYSAATRLKRRINIEAIEPQDGWTYLFAYQSSLCQVCRIELGSTQLPRHPGGGHLDFTYFISHLLLAM